MIGRCACRGGRARDHSGRPPCTDLVRSFRQVKSCSSDADLDNHGDHRHRNEMEVEAACVVLGNHDRFRGSSCPADLVRSVDDQVGSRLRNNPNRHGRPIPNALGPFGRREVHGGAESL